MRSAWFASSELARMIRGGTMTDAKSIAAYAPLVRHTGGRGRHSGACLETTAGRADMTVSPPAVVGGVVVS